MAEVLIVSLGSTSGLRAADAELAGALERAGRASPWSRRAPPREVRTLALTDLVWARAARAAAQRGIAEHGPRAVVYATVTAALLWPRPGAIRYDAPAAANRPGRHGLWQRPLERRRLREAPLLVPQAPGTLAESPSPHAPAVVVAIPVEPSGRPRRPARHRGDHLRGQPGEEGARSRARGVGRGAARGRGARRHRHRARAARARACARPGRWSPPRTARCCAAPASS